jgi:AmiR/NasT family two-component response regulator
VTNLTEAMESRKVIGQATGILMERFRIDEAHAFAYLRRESSHRNVKLRDIAAELTQSITEPEPGAEG